MPFHDPEIKRAYDRAYNRARNATPEYKVYKKAYNRVYKATPEQKVYNKAYYAAWYEQNRPARAAYDRARYCCHIGSRRSDNGFSCKGCGTNFPIENI